MKAFTLVELLIVMAIIGMATALGIAGMISFRRAVLLQQSSEEFLTTLKETRSFAENNVLPFAANSSSKIYAYSIIFKGGNNGKLERRLCSLDTNTPGATWLCSPNGTNLKSDAFNDMEYVLNRPLGCEEILIENLTGDILIKRKLNQDYIDERCQIMIKHESIDKTNVIIDIDGELNFFKLTNEEI